MQVAITAPSNGHYPVPLPKSLRLLPEQFSLADEHGITPDLTEGVRRLVQSAWDGSMIPGENSSIPLADAICRSTAELDSAAMAFLATVPIEMTAMIGAAFNTMLFSQDVVKAFTNLKNLSFDGMGTRDFDNIQAALSKQEHEWRQGPKKIEVFVIQQFCLRMVDFATSLKQRTGRTFEAAPATGSSPSPSPSPSSSSSLRQVVTQSTAFSERVMNYQNERIVGSSQWPSCVDNNKPNWASLFGLGSEMYELGAEDQDIWLTPRMAAKIHHIAIADGHSLLEDISCKLLHPRLPKISRPFFQKSNGWRLAFRDCYVRIGLRLQKGLPPQPNCTGEEMAFDNIMRRVPDAEEELYEEFESLPKYPKDDDYSTVRDYAVEDNDVLELFESNDHGFDDSDNEDHNDPNVDNPILGPGSKADFMLGSGGAMMRTANLHPKDWFLAFRNDRFRDHIQSNLS